VNKLIRWGKFNLVGAIGMVVQLAALVLFNKWVRGHYLIASAAALELTMITTSCKPALHAEGPPQPLHSFRPIIPILSFKSMLRNLALMRILVQAAHVPLLISNFIAMLFCSIVNSYLGDTWVSGTTHTAQSA
jgi:putative flippase GtrA